MSPPWRVGLRAWGDLDQDVDVTAIVGLPAQDRTEQREAADAQGSDLRLALRETPDSLDAVPNWRRHLHSYRNQSPSANPCWSGPPTRTADGSRY